MELRERTAMWNRNGGHGPDASGPDFTPTRNDTRQFMRAGRDAIERALSGNSPAFLNAAEQVDGE